MPQMHSLKHQKIHTMLVSLWLRVESGIFPVLHRADFPFPQTMTAICFPQTLIALHPSLRPIATVSAYQFLHSPEMRMQNQGGRKIWAILLSTFLFVNLDWFSADACAHGFHFVCEYISVLVPTQLQEFFLQSGLLITVFHQFPSGHYLSVFHWTTSLSL